MSVPRDWGAEAIQHEESLLLEEEHEGTEPEEAEPTSFDDVAMILLLFFMVTSLMIFFPREKQEEKSRKIPIMDDKTLMAHPPAGVTHRLFVKTDEKKNITLEIQLLGAKPEVNTDETKYFMGSAHKWNVKEVDTFKKGVLAMIERIKGVKDKQYPVDVVVFFDHDLGYGKMQKVWHSLNTLGNKNGDFQSKVARIAWRSEVITR